MRKTFQKYLPIIALVAGFIWAFITAGVYSILFAFLPLLAFVFGYFSTWRWGLLNGFLLFFGYTMATAIMWRDILNAINILTYFYTFASGGFSLLLISALATLVKKGIRNFGSIGVIILLAATVSWCAYDALPTYSYYYQVIVHSSENIDDLELYLPVGTVSEELYAALYNSPLRVPGKLTENYDKELVDTEHGQMLRITIPKLMNEGPPGYPYTGNIIFTQENPPHKTIHLMPRYEVNPIGTVESREFRGPLKVRESLLLEEFRVPIMVKSGAEAKIELRLENRTGKGETINFSYSKSNTYTELIEYEGSTGGEWRLAPVKVTDRLNIRGIGD